MGVAGAAIFWVLGGVWLYLIRPSSFVHGTPAVQMTRGRKVFLTALMLALIALLGFLMTLSPVWNGEIPGHRNQYELITESFLQGRLDFGYEADPGLLEMENPYDYDAREAAGVKAPFDHAYYQGKFYMYFGVVPVFLAFMPYRLVTGHALVTWHATFFFILLFVLGLAVWLYWWAKRFFPRMTWGAWVSLFALFTLVSALYTAKYPSLYQTPVACGMMLEVWSLYFFCRAFGEEEKKEFSLGFACLGALAGALTFGCRPPLAMANLLVIPLFIFHLRGRRFTGSMLRRLCIAVIPYVLVAAGLMWYNGARFGNPFEFGQTYQITITDQTSYSSMFTKENLVRAPAGIFNSLFVVSPIDMLFPYLRTGNGALAVCPMLLFSFAFLMPRSRRVMKKQGLRGFAAVLMLTVMLISALQMMWSPKLLDRYQSDFLWLLSVGAFAGIGACFEWTGNRKKLSWLISLGAAGCVVLAALVFLVPFDNSFTGYDQDAIVRIWNFLTLRGIR